VCFQEKENIPHQYVISSNVDPIRECHTDQNCEGGDVKKMLKLHPNELTCPDTEKEVSMTHNYFTAL
jgi:hypothetical protein